MLRRFFKDHPIATSILSAAFSLFLLAIGFSPNEVAARYFGEGGMILLSARVLALVGLLLFLLLVAWPAIAEWLKPTAVIGIKVKNVFAAEAYGCKMLITIKTQHPGFPNPLYLKTCARWSDVDNKPRAFRLGSQPKVLPVFWRDRLGLCVLHESGKRYRVRDAELDGSVICESKAGQTRRDMKIKIGASDVAITLLGPEDHPEHRVRFLTTDDEDALRVAWPS